MISLYEAQRHIHSRPVDHPRSETVALEYAVGRVLAESPVSDQDLPPFDRVTMDGYAVRSRDLSAPGRLRCVGEVAAGAVATTPLGAGEVYRVMTGAPLPPGADAVVKVEETREDGDWVSFELAAKTGQNIHPHAGDLKVGDQPLAAGRRITTATIPLLATLGCAAVRVFCRPRVSILTSGNELVDMGERPKAGQIRDSNRVALATQVRAAGGDPECQPIVRDDAGAMEAAVRRSAEHDFLLLTGGSSVGRYDYSHDVVAATGAALLFQKVAIKPGKPVLYFVRDHQQVFCLPGNPVSAFVTFELLVRPAIEACAGLREVWPRPLMLPLRSPLKAPQARDLLQVSLIEAGDDGWTAEPIRWHGSGDLVSIARANALVWIRAGSAASAGDLVAVFPLRRHEESLPRAAEPIV